MYFGIDVTINGLYITLSYNYFWTAKIHGSRLPINANIQKLFEYSAQNSFLKQANTLAVRSSVL